MASINRSRQTAYPELAEDDPFAELTRIMTRDPNALGRGGDDGWAANDTIGIDLEAELLNNLSSFDHQPAEQTAAVVPQEAELADAARPHADDGMSDHYIADAMDAEFDAAFDDGWPDAGEAVTSSFDETQGGAVSWREAAGEAEPAGYQETGVVRPVDFAAEAPEAAADPVEDKLHLFDRIAAELRDGASSRHPFHMPQASAGGAAAYEQAARYEEVEPAYDSAASHLDDGERADTTDHHATDEPVSWTSESMIWIDGQQAADEYAAGGERVDAAGQEVVHPQFEQETETEVDELALAAELEASFADETAADEGADAAETAEAFDYRVAAADRHDYLDDAFNEAPTVGAGSIESGLEAETPVAGQEGLPQEAEPIAAAPAAPSQPKSIFTAPFWNAAQRQQPPAAAPVATSEPEEPVVPVVEMQADVATVHAAPFVEDAATEPFIPEVETVDIEERATAVVDDLDIPEPELQAGAPADAEFDDLAAELAGAFGEITDEALAEPVPQAPVAAAAFAVDNQPVMQDASATAANDQLFELETAIAAPAFAHGFEPSGRQDYNAWAGGIEEEEAPAEQYVARRRPQWSIGRRGAIGAAAIAAVVLLGGVSVFALSSGGAGLGQPALVKASDDPFKVKPENPGGTKVSDDNNEVYQRASGNVGDAPAQKTLMTSAEAPLDLSARTAPRIIDASAIAPVDDEGSALTDADANAKSQARLTPAEDSASDAEAPGPITVQAHRVKTFIVRPDGTLVPRENPPETVADNAPAVNDASAEAGEDNVAALAQPSDEGAVDATPTGSAATQDAPAQPAPAAEAEPQPAEVASAAASSPAVEKPALAPAATQAASEWSVQISSQPTAEAAQTSYQRMAQRYGDLLGGRGVNIVKADISGKGTYYRVRIPSSSKDDAVELCSKLKSAGGSCFVSK